MTRICSCSGGSASMLEISRKGKQLKKADCGTCGGRPLVDGIEPESASMLSTFDLEFSSFINPELTWKKVKKGCRSTTRRSRKSVNRNLNVGAESGNKRCERDQDSSVSESEKLGVAVLGRRFAEKIVDVPIKKRRFSIRPPSPRPRTPSPDHEGSLSPHPQSPSPLPIQSEQLVDIKPSGAGYANDDDFSGIELLAAAACSSSIDNDVKPKEMCAVKAYADAEAVDSHNVVIPFKESIASSGTNLFSDKDLVNEDDMGESAVNETTIAAVSKTENGGVVRNRAHWDLNTVMEAWEEPVDVRPVNSQIYCSENVLGGTHCEKINVEKSVVQSNLEDVRSDTERVDQSVMCKEVPREVEVNKELVVQEDTLKSCSSPEGAYIEKQYVTTPTERVREALNVSVYDTIASIHVTSIETSGNHLCSVSQHTACLHVFEEKMLASNSELEQVGEVSCGTSAEENRKLLSGDPQAGKLEIFTPNLPLLNNIGHEINDTQIKDCNVYEYKHESPDSKTSPRQVISTLTYKTSDVGNSMGESDKANHFHPSPKGEALSASSTSVVVGEVKLLADKASAADNNVNDVTLQNGLMGLFGKSNNCPSKMDQENNTSDCFDSYATKDGKKVDMEHISEYEAGYDSSFEDGELREPGVYVWEENDLEGETEYVDYGSEYGDGDDFDTVNSKSTNAENGKYQSSRKGTSLGKNDDIENVDAGGNRSAVAGDSVKSLEQCFNGDALDGSHSACMKTKISAGDQFNEHLDYRVADGTVDGYNDKSLYGEFESREFRGKLSTFSKGPSPFDVVERNTSLDVHRNRFGNSNYSYSRAERDFGLVKSMGRERFSIKSFGSKNETDGRYSPASHRDTRNRYPHSYRGPESNAYSRPRDSTATSGTKIGGFNCEDDRRSMNYSSNNGPYRSFMGRRSPADREDSYFGHRGIPPVRGIGQDRSRGRSGRHVQGIRRGPRDEYSEDISDDISLRPIRRQPYYSRRERGLSPNYRGGQFLRTRRNSRSRSRTRSPVAWNSQRERNMNTKRRSPDFRSDARMERIRSPFQKSFGTDNEEIYISSPRGRVPPHSNSRWLNDGNYMDNHFRDRRSPVRMFSRSQRLDSVGYSGRKSDDIFQPNIRGGRFQQVSSIGRGGPDLEGSDAEKKKHDDRYEINHRVRRYDAGGAVRRFRYDADDCFQPRNAHKDDGFGRAIKRDIPRNGAGEERGLRYNSDRMYAGASSAGQRDFDENAATREE